MAEILSKDEQDLFDKMKQADKSEDTKAETKTEIKPGAKEEKKEEKLVPLAALHEARLQNKELKGELQGLKDIVATGDRKLQSFIEGLQKQAAPKFEEDPAGALKHENETLKAQINKIQERITQSDLTAKQQQDLTKFSVLVQAKEKEFSKENTDYYKAAEFVAEIWRDEFQESGFDEAEIPQLVFRKSLSVTWQANQKEKNPAEAIYKIAKRYGWGKETKEKVKTDEEKLEKIEKGQDFKSISGGTGPNDLSFSNLASMSDEQINKLVNDPELWNKHIRRSPLH